ncbi:aldo/keto reductase [Orbus wheelerorum]|uniref:aldo/keto reductase n=1 Tax=Orbus wheelerorum TaxID=3074111 RepID=UPI00370D63F1
MEISNKAKLGQKCLSRVGLGCMGMSEFYGLSDRLQNLDILNKAVELGYQHFDTSDMYGMGENEKLLGEFIQGQNRKSLFISTKFGIKRGPHGGLTRLIDGSRIYVKEALEKSLERLRLDYVDLYYIHRRDSATPIEETISALAELKQQGLIREIGLCEVSLKTYLQAQAVHPIAAVQSEYSLLSKEPEGGILQACKENNTAFVAYSPMSRGLLTGNLNADSINKTGDARQNLPRFSAESLNHNLSLVTALDTLAKSKGCHPAQIALAWVLHQGEHIHIIPGTRREKYLIDNFNSIMIELSPLELETMRAHFSDDNIIGARYSEATMSGINN